jgi:hypothetical protein
MAKIGRLTALKVTRATAPGMYADGGGLYLQATVNARDGEPAKSRIYRYMLRGRAREMGLGSLSAIGLQAKRGKPLSNMAFLMLPRRMGREDMTTHGFRSTFRDWAAERTHFPSEAAEMALAHTVGDKVEAAYRRGDMFERRRRIMAEWAKFRGTVKSAAENKIIAIGKKGDGAWLRSTADSRKVSRRPSCVRRSCCWIRCRHRWDRAS